MPKKKQKTQIKSPAKKDGDIRALFSITTKSTKNYTKLITDLGVPNDGSVTTSLINLLVDITIDNNITPNCFVCENICNCSLFTNTQTHKNKPLIFLNDLKLPNIDLIDDIDKETLMKCKKVDDVVHVFIKQENYAENINDCTHNFDLEFDFDLPTTSDFPREEEIKEEEKLNFSNNFDIGDIDDIFADNSPPAVIKKEIVETKEEVKEKEALGFFGLDSIDDIFADSDDDIKAIEVEVTIKEENNNNNLICSPVKKELQNTEDPIEYPLSPSILSGRTKPRESPKSPILLSQSRRLPLKSTPINSIQIDKIKKVLPTGLSNIDLTDEKGTSQSNVIQNSLTETTNKSMFTITQLVEMINKTQEDKSSKDKSNNGYSKYYTIDEKERSISPILLTQSLINKTSNVNKATKPNNTGGRNSLIILDSDSDSNDTQAYDLESELNNAANETCLTYFNKKDDRSEQVIRTVSSELSNTNSIQKTNNSKRKLDIDESMQASPYFNKKQKIESCDSKKSLTLQEKVLAAITSQKLNMFNDNPTVLNFTVSQPNVVSQKENQNPCVQNDILPNDDKPHPMKNSKLEMLQVFRRENKSRTKITFDDSDDDFIIDEKYYRSPQRPVADNKSNTTNHKVRKVSVSY